MPRGQCCIWCRGHGASEKDRNRGVSEAFLPGGCQPPEGYTGTRCSASGGTDHGGLYAERSVLYEKYAHVTVEEDGLTIEETLEKTLQALDLLVE